MPHSRNLLASAALAALVLPVGVAQAQTVEFRGGGYLTDAAGCPTWWSGNIVFRARFRPANTQGNGTVNRMTLFLGAYVYHLTYPVVSVGGTVDSTRWGSIGSGLDLNSAPTPRVRALAPPANTAFGANEMHLVGEILNFDFREGCTIRFTMWLGRHE